MVCKLIFNRANPRNIDYDFLNELQAVISVCEYISMIRESFAIRNDYSSAASTIDGFKVPWFWIIFVVTAGGLKISKSVIELRSHITKQRQAE